MEIEIHGKHIDLGDALRQHVTAKLEEIDSKYFNHATKAVVIFSKQGHGHGTVKVTIAYNVSKHISVNTEGEAGDAYGAFDQAADKAGKRLRRNKRRLRDHQDRAEKTPETEILKATNYTLAMADLAGATEQNNHDDGVPLGEDPVVIAEMMTRIETLSVSDAVMRLDLSGEPALLFRNASHNGLNLVYRRGDGNVGWVDPAEAKERAA